MASFRLIAVAAVACAALAVGIGCGGDDDGGSDSGLEPGEPVKVGLNLELSGSGEFFGRSREIGAKVAVADINAEGGIEIDGEQHPLEIVSCDNRTDPTVGVTCAEEAAEEGVTWTIAPDAGFDAAYEIYKEDEIISIANGGAPGRVLQEDAENNPLLFSEFLIFPEYIASHLAQTRALYPDAERLAYLVPDDENGRIFGEGFDAAAEEYGFEVVAQEFHPPDATGDFSSILTSMKAANPDIAYLSFLPQVTIPAVEQAANLDVAPIFATDLLTPTDFEGVDFTGHEMVAWHVAWAYAPPEVVPQQDPGQTGSEQLINKLQAEAGGDPYLTSVATAAYITDTYMVAKAIEAAGTTNGEDVAEELLGSTYDGPLGPATFREDLHDGDLAQTTFAWDEQGNVSVQVFDSGFQEQPSYSFDVAGG
jgi:branched-chain amino acid transport system substrate-binding protein